MKPNFALSLSFDGIRLLHRAAGGWRLVGEVALDSPELAQELSVLRKTASGLEPGGVRSKLLLPNEQIKYLTIDAGGDEATRRDAAKAALAGATPYPVEELAFDISADGDRTHVAAVARETLDEAEAFAVEHRFHPVSFAAVPGDLPYLGEPYFGTARGAADLIDPGEAVEPDGIAVVIIGDAAPAAPVAETATAEPQAEAPKIAPLPDPVAEPEPDPLPSETPVFAATRTQASADLPTEENAQTAPSAAPAPEAPAPAVDSAEQPAASPPTGFASRRGQQRKLRVPLDHAARIEPQLSATSAPAVPPGTITAAEIPIEPEQPVAAPTPAPRGGFLSRRKTGAPKAAPAVQKAFGRKAVEHPIPVALPPEGSEEERMTIFGARQSAVGGKPRFLGLILTAALLVLLAGVAAWASVFLDDNNAFSRLFGSRAPEVAENAAPVAVETPTPAVIEPEAPLPVQTASLSPSLTDEDTAVLDALRDPVEPLPPRELTESELAERYAVTGIWPVPPVVPPEPAALIGLDDLYLTSIDPISTANDAVALPAPRSFATDQVFAALSNPAAPGTQFSFDARGLVIPTAKGTVNPDGVLVFLGRPPAVPPATPTRFQTEPEDTEVRSALAAFRPQPRPSDLAETNERAQLGGLTRQELAAFRPALRPKSVQEEAAALAAAAAPAAPVDTDEAVTEALATPAAFENPTRLAIAASVRPDTRPRNFSRIVKRAQRNPDNQEVRVASAATIAPRSVTPKIPTKASVSRQATVKNAINLRKINLIGVYGKPSSRRALVRLSNGRYKKVEVGDRLDGGRVAAIGDSELRYVKGGRNMVLKMPR